MNNTQTPFGIRRNLNYMKTNYKLCLKGLIEYKVNFWGAVFAQIFYLGVFTSFFLILSSNFGDVINWTTTDFITYFVLIDTLWMCAGMFIWGASLHYTLKGGGLNTFLTKPLNTFIANYFHNMDAGGIVMIAFNIPIIIYLIQFKATITIPTLLTFLAVCIFIVFFIFVIMTFIESLEFIYLGTSINVFTLYGTLANSTNEFPYNFFQKLKFKSILFGVYTTYIAVILIPLLQTNQLPQNTSFILTTATISILTLFIITLLNWHFGLKKYEAFG